MIIDAYARLDITIYVFIFDTFATCMHGMQEDFSSLSFPDSVFWDTMGFSDNDVGPEKVRFQVPVEIRTHANSNSITSRRASFFFTICMTAVVCATMSSGMAHFVEV